MTAIDNLRAALEATPAGDVLILPRDALASLLAAYDAIADGSAVREARGRAAEAIARAGEAEERAARATAVLDDERRAYEAKAARRAANRADATPSLSERISGIEAAASVPTSNSLASRIASLEAAADRAGWRDCGWLP
jgi:hypothetical protein